MSYRIDLSSLSKNIEILVPESKSVLHRELIVNFMLLIIAQYIDEEKMARIITPSCNDSDDIRATRACLKALYEATLDDSKRDIYMPCGESGSTLRFMISVGIAVLHYKGLADRARLVFMPQGQLINRPLKQLVDCLGEHGVEVGINYEDGLIYVEGDIRPGKFIIEGNVSSQYISGLLMACVLLNEDDNKSVVCINGSLESGGYVDITLDVLRAHGIDVIKNRNEYSLKRIESYIVAENNVESDWSSAAFLLCLGACLRDTRMRLYGLRPDSRQKDIKILTYLSDLNIDVLYDEISNSYVLDSTKMCNNKEKLNEIYFDAGDCPDIVPYMAVLAAGFTARTTFRHISRLRYKESDRVRAVIEVLASGYIDAHLSEDGDDLIVEYSDPAQCSDIKPVCTYNDHRIAMMACILSALLDRTCVIDNRECIKKSFPGLLDIIDFVEISRDEQR